MPSILGSIALAAWAAASSPPAHNKVVAVLEFQSQRMEAEYLQGLSDQARAGVLSGTRGRALSVMTRENMLVMQREMGKCDATEGECEVETGRSIGADFIVVGSVVQLPRSMTLSLRFMETERGTLLAAESISGASLEDVLPKVRETTERMVRDGLLITEPSASGLSFGNAVTISVPTIQVQSGSSSALSDLNIEAEELVEKAKRLQGDDSAAPRAKATAWCQLAALKDRNPYLPAATEGCQSWTRYAEQHETLQKNAEVDIDKLRRFVRLEGRTPQEKLEAARSYVRTYQQLPRSSLVAEANTILNTLDTDIKRAEMIPRAQQEWNAIQHRFGGTSSGEYISAIDRFTGRYGLISDHQVVAGARAERTRVENALAVERQERAAEEQRRAENERRMEYEARMRRQREADEARETEEREAREKAAREKREAEEAKARSPLRFLPSVGTITGVLGTLGLIALVLLGIAGGLAVGALAIGVLTGNISLGSLPVVGTFLGGSFGVVFVVLLVVGAVAVGGVILFLWLKNR